jgi:excinuclease UvrABC nuclease subunit
MSLVPTWTETFDAGMRIAPPLGEDQLSHVPTRRGVFALAAGGGEPVLVATAADIRARLRNRLTAEPGVSARRADLREISAAVFWKLADSHFETDWRYLQAVRAAYPDTYRAVLSFHPAWFVHVDPAAETPVFRRDREVLSGPGRWLGPFPDKQAAQRMIESLADAFDLCRCEQVLQRAPEGSACVYAQMGRCGAWCDGRTPMADYRRLIAEAVDYAAGRREGLRRELAERMRRAADERDYEQAAACKARLERLAQLDEPAFEHVADAERFQYLLFQPGHGVRRAKVFAVDRGWIGPHELSFPFRQDQLQAVLEELAGQAAGPRTIGRAEREVIGLASHYLFVAAERRGLPVRWRPDLTAAGLIERLEARRERLKLPPE